MNPLLLVGASVLGIATTGGLRNASSYGRDLARIEELLRAPEGSRATATQKSVLRTWMNGGHESHPKVRTNGEVLYVRHGVQEWEVGWVVSQGYATRRRLHPGDREDYPSDEVYALAKRIVRDAQKLVDQGESTPAPRAVVSELAQQVDKIGVPDLPDDVLLALMLSGSERDPLPAARAAIGEYDGNLERLLRGMSATNTGLSKESVLRLRASREIVRRAAHQEAMGGTTTIVTPSDVHKHVCDHVPGEVESMVILYLNRRRQVLATRIISRGSYRYTVGDTLAVLRPAVELQASGIILVHNHPSGDPSPSAQDVTLTETISRASRTLGIQTLDHVVVTAKRFVSMREQGNGGLG